MSMLKVIEVLAESDKSWDAAAQVAVDTARERAQCALDLHQEPRGLGEERQDPQVPGQRENLVRAGLDLASP